MSRIGKKPIPLPSGVKIKIGEQLEVTGPKGSLKVPIPEGISFEQIDGRLDVKRASDEQAALRRVAPPRRAPCSTIARAG